MSKKDEVGKNEGPYKYFHLNYQGELEELKRLLKKKIGFDFKDMGNNTIYIKVKKEDYEDFSLFVQQSHSNGTSIKSYFEITEDVYKGALLSLDKILHPK